MTIEVIDPGRLTTVQDRGRPGFAHLGVTGSGVADRAAAARAHRLVGDDPGAALLETLLGGLTLRTDRDRLVAVTGAPAPVTIAGRPHPTGRVLRWPAGSTLALGEPPVGLRTYLAVRGGFAVAAELGSRSTDTLGGLGPAPLAAGDTLPIGEQIAGPPARCDAHERWAAGELLLDAGPGPRADRVDLAALAGPAFTVTADLDRVGVRLTGWPVAWTCDGELPSEGVVRGAVQVPPSGEPVVFAPDHPTTGGYPVAAVLTAAAADLLAQARPGTVVRLRLANRRRTRRPPLAMMSG